eukprot:scaffold173651_cov29-Tisochrysis_lutea.AAC.1
MPKGLANGASEERPHERQSSGQGTRENGPEDAKIDHVEGEESFQVPAHSALLCWRRDGVQGQQACVKQLDGDECSHRAGFAKRDGEDRAPARKQQLRGDTGAEQGEEGAVEVPDGRVELKREGSAEAHDVEADERRNGSELRAQAEDEGKILRLRIDVVEPLMQLIGLLKELAELAPLTPPLQMSPKER